MATEYLVLVKTGEFYDIVRDSIEAASAEQARRNVAKEKNADGTYVAVPLRSWTEEDLYFEVPEPILRSRSEKPEPLVISQSIEEPSEIIPDSRKVTQDELTAA